MASYYPAYLKREDCPPVAMATSLSKAISSHETAVKEKHVRSAIIGTYQERGASTFWECVQRNVGLKENAIVCWKFCHVLHKVLREGHENVLRDSQRYKHMLGETGRFWGHLKSGYGGLVKLYCALLYNKLYFHQRNGRIPGSLIMNDQQLMSCTGGDGEDANFQLSVEMFDYLDAIIELESEIFKTMDSAKCNSMTNSGQCRLKPLIPCIQDSMLLYDYTTKILFRLHAKLPQDMLSGHRERFLKVFNGLKGFYEKTMSLQYFKNLIEIQQLPRDPPNFLVQSDLENYETRKVTVLSSEKDLTDAQSDNLSELVDLQESNNNTNGGSVSPDPSLMALVYEKERVAKELETENENLRHSLERLRNEAKNQIHHLQFEKQELKADLNEKTAQLEEKNRKLESQRIQDSKSSGEHAERLEKSERQSKVLEEKFGKMKEVYSNLREEHIQLLRKHALVEKELNEAKKSVEGVEANDKLIQDLKKEKESLEERMAEKIREAEERCAELNQRITQLTKKAELAEKEKSDVEMSMLRSLKGKEELSQEMEKRVLEQKSKIEELQQEKADEIKTLMDERKGLERKVDELRKEVQSIESSKREMEAELKGKEAGLRAELGVLSSENLALRESKQGLHKKFDELSERLEKMSLDLSSAEEANEKHKSQIIELQVRMTENAKKLEAEALSKFIKLLEVCLKENEGIVKSAMEDLDNPLLSGGAGSLDHLIIFVQATESVVNIMEETTKDGLNSFDSIKSVIGQIVGFTHHMTTLMVHGSATSRSSPDIQKGDDLLNECRNVGASVLELIEAIRQTGTGSNRRSSSSQLVNEAYKEIRGRLLRLLEISRSMGLILNKADVADALEKELSMMEAAIEEAAKKMEEMLSASRASHSGVKLEVNEKLIDSCTGLMNAIRLLVQRAKGLQSEIVAEGRGTASIKEFYKRNNQWTEGLISAAKSVGIGAKFLMESADKALTNEGRTFEYLIASSQEIAASTVQLVIASQVRAARGSNNLALLKQASTGVKTATAHVVATSKDCALLIDESDEVDVSQISPHNAKRLELETQAEVLRLESDLEKWRMKLAALRQHHYHNSD